MRKSLFVLTAFVCLGAEPAMAQQPREAGPRAELIQVDSALSAGVRCNWLTPLQREGLEAAVRETRFKIQAAAGPNGNLEANDAHSAALLVAKTIQCTGPQADQARRSIEAAAEDVAGIYLYRADQVINQIKDPWAAGIARITAKPGALAAALDARKAKDPKGYRVLELSNPLDAAIIVLAMVCPERMGKDAECPMLEDVPAAFLPAARSWLSETERYADAWAKAQPAP